MSQHEVERVIGRAGTDSAFRKVLISDTREACSGYDLTEEDWRRSRRLTARAS